MAKATTTKQCLPFPALAPGAMLAVLLRLVEQGFTPLIDSELGIKMVGPQAWALYLPAHSKLKDRSEADFDALRDQIKVNYRTQADYQVGREADQGHSVSTEGIIAPLEAAITLALHCPTEDGNSDEPFEKMVFVSGPKAQIAPVMADVIRNGRSVRTAGVLGLGDGKSGGFLVFTDKAEDYGSVSAYFARDDVKATTFVLRPYGLGNGRLWLTEHAPRPRNEAITALASIVEFARVAHLLAKDITDIVCVAQNDTSLNIYYHAASTTTDAPTASDTLAPVLDPVQPFDVISVEIRPNEDAAAALAQTIKSLRRRVGYQVAIEPLQHGIAPGIDVEPLLEKIDDLQLQIDQITALGAPQRRLMRFTDAQLPAMIDGLRKLPPGKLRDGSLMYAASHSAGRAEPAHYLAYDPSFTFMRVAETRWRAETDPHPISYWLEPFVAEAQVGGASKTQVFVPSGHFLVPSLAHFGGDVDETLALVLGNLFDSQTDLIIDNDRSAFYLFTPSPAEEFRLEVEVLDGDTFAALHQQLHWINDYLQVRSPVAVDADKLAAVATGLYEGAAAKALADDLEADIAALDQAWAEASKTASVDAVGMINAISQEMKAVSDRIIDLHSYLDLAGKNMQALEKVATSATNALRGADGVMDTLTAQDDHIARTRRDFESRIAAEVELAENAITKSQTQIEALQGRLKSVRDWVQS